MSSSSSVEHPTRRRCVDGHWPVATVSGALDALPCVASRCGAARRRAVVYAKDSRRNLLLSLVYARRSNSEEFTHCKKCKNYRYLECYNNVSIPNLTLTVARLEQFRFRSPELPVGPRWQSACRSDADQCTVGRWTGTLQHGRLDINFVDDGGDLERDTLANWQPVE